MCDVGRTLVTNLHDENGQNTDGMRFEMNSAVDGTIEDETMETQVRWKDIGQIFVVLTRVIKGTGNDNDSYVPKKENGKLMLTVKWLCPGCRRKLKCTNKVFAKQYRERVNARLVHDGNQRKLDNAAEDMADGMENTAMEKVD